MMITSKDVAALAGVSPTTVSRVFRGDNKVKSETVKTVLKIAEELNYIPNYSASILKQKRSRIISIIVPDMNNPFFMDIANRIGERVKSKGYNFLISYNNNDIHSLIENIKLFISFQAECIIFCPLNNLNFSTKLENLIKGHKETRFLQLYNNKYKTISNITYDDNYGMYLGMKYLLQNNHRRILVVSNDPKRFSGYKKAYEEFGILEPLIPFIEFSNNSLFKDIDLAINKFKPTAIFGIANKYGSAVYEVIKKNSLKIYDDISFLMYDDLDWVKLLDISTIGQPVDKLVELASKIAIRPEYTKSSIKYNPFIIKRRSVRCL